MAEGQYRIVKVQLPLLGGIAGHNFLALIDPNGNVIGELHGLATDAEGRAKPIGNLPSDRLKGHDDERWYQPDFAQAEVATGNQSEIMNRWNAARAASDKMDARDIQYPWMGLGQNSNSFASTLIAVMGLTEPRMPGGAFVMPGAGSMLGSQGYSGRPASVQHRCAQLSQYTDLRCAAERCRSAEFPRFGEMAIWPCWGAKRTHNSAAGRHAAFHSCVPAEFARHDCSPRRRCYLAWWAERSGTDSASDPLARPSARGFGSSRRSNAATVALRAGCGSKF